MKNIKNNIKPVSKKIAKVPQVIQMEMLECGAASLAMILEYYKKFVPLTELRKMCGISRDGSNAKNILLTARYYGLKAKGYRLEPENLKAKGIFPCIIHWNFNHFVVLCGFKGDKAVINDPASGRRVVEKREFDESFTGICMFFEPGENFKPEGSKKSIISYVIPKLKGSMDACALVVCSTIITSLITLILYILGRIYTDELLTNGRVNWLISFLGVFTIIAVVEIISSWITVLYNYKINGKIAILSDSLYMWHLIRLPMDFFSQRTVGDVLSRKSTNATIATSFIKTFTPLTIQAVLMFFNLFIIIKYSPLLSVLGVLSVALNLFVSRIIANKRVDITKVMANTEGRLQGQTVAGIEMIETLKASGAENGFFEKWSGYQAKAYMERDKIERLSAYMKLVPDIFSAITDTLVFIGCLYLVMSQKWTIGMIAAFQGFLTQFTTPAMQFVQASQSITELRTDIERIDDVMNYKTDSMYDTKKDDDSLKSKLSGDIVIKDVTFGYSMIYEPLIKNLNITIKPGEKIAFVGPSGCGKSTIAKLLSGLNKAWEGEILFDGKKFEEIDRRLFTSSLGVVDQDITLYEDSIADNIKMWDETIEDFEMILAARDAAIHEKIIKRDGGYDGKLLEGGKDMSGGERQRLEIARVLAQDPSIIVLDEATSALDAVTERKIINAIKNRGITCIIVAHRLSTIKDCDKIYVLDKGKIVEMGKHEELFAKGGYYTQLIINE